MSEKKILKEIDSLDKRLDNIAALVLNSSIGDATRSVASLEAEEHRNYNHERSSISFLLMGAFIGSFIIEGTINETLVGFICILLILIVGEIAHKKNKKNISKLRNKTEKLEKLSKIHVEQTFADLKF